MAGTEGWSITELEELRVLHIRQAQLPTLRCPFRFAVTCCWPLTSTLQCPLSVSATMHDINLTMSPSSDSYSQLPKQAGVGWLAADVAVIRSKAWTEQLPYKLPLRPLIALLPGSSLLGGRLEYAACKSYQCRHPQMPCVPFNGSLNISAAMHASTEMEESYLTLNHMRIVQRGARIGELPAIWPVVWMLRSIQATFVLCPGSMYQLRPAKHTLAPLSADNHPFRKVSNSVLSAV